MLITKRTLVLTLLFLFAFSFRFAYINKGPFHYDTLDLALTASRTLSTMTLHYEHGSGYPLTVILGALFIFIFKFFGVTDPVFCVNFMSVVTGALGVLLLFFLVERLFDFHRAMFSAILLSCFFPHIMISTFGKSLIPGICFALASAYYMVRYTQEQKNSFLVFSAVFLGFCGAARLSDILVVFPISYLFFSGRGIFSVKIRQFIVFGALVLLSAGIFYVPMFLEKGVSQFSEVLLHKEQAKFLGLFSYVFIYACRWLLEFFTIAGIILAAWGLSRMLARVHLREFFFLMLWFLVLQFFYGNISSSGPRYLVIAWIPLIVAQGYFLGSLKGRRFYFGFFIVFVLFLNAFLRYSPVLEFRHKHALQKDFAEWVQAKTSPDSAVIAMDESIFIDYYGKRTIVWRPITCNQQEIDRFFKEEVDSKLEGSQKVFIIGTAIYAYDECGLFKKILKKRYQMIFVGAHINEEWHHAFLNQDLVTEDLYQIKKR